MKLKELFKGFKRRELKRLNKKSKDTGMVFYENIYQDNNIENIYKIFINKENQALLYQTKANCILNFMNQSSSSIKREIEECSTFTNVYIIDEKLVEDLITITSIFNGYRRCIKDEKENVYYLLLSGSIYDYRELINSSNIDNSVTQSVIESLYQTNSIYFSDMRDIMELREFVDDDNIKIKYYNRLESDTEEIYEITPIHEIYDRIKKFGFTVEDAVNLSSAIFTISDDNKLYRKLSINNIFNSNEFTIINFIRDEVNNMVDNIEQYFIPVFKRVQEDTSGYDLIDEPLEDEIKTTSYEKKTELIYEGEDGEIYYDPKDFE